ncbi:hypothetical protein [Burkholderia gladioli]|uniref:hypothetical protein n=1 Tax=Burkholderia gladioli TaxID=28095 RepID=UPI000CFF7754|nr:hypothetical protein [Burkholderia gladioli]MBU9276937.1 hypothetical protein [Burkholderia gladioli]PRE26137.1 hypothetical protein C6P72_09855 [Burkholderia gladioli]
MIETETATATSQELSSGGDLDERARIRQHLRDAYQVESMFVRVSALSRILGIAASSLRASMRGGRFPLPHVVVCSTPLVRTDQLVDWILASATSRGSPLLSQEHEAEPAPDDHRQHVDNKPSQAAMRSLRRQLVGETLARMRAQSSERAK